MDYSFIFLIIAIFVARFIQMNAFKTLADEDKAKVMSRSIMQLSQVNLLFTVVLVVAFYFTINKFPDRFTGIASIFFTVLILQRITVYILTRKRMISNDVPASYLSKYFLAWLVTTVGVMLFIILFMWQGNGIGSR